MPLMLIDLIIMQHSLDTVLLQQNHFDLREALFKVSTRNESRFLGSGHIVKVYDN